MATGRRASRLTIGGGRGTCRGHDDELVFLPTYSSWLNLIECQFGALRAFALNGSDYGSHAEQGAAIHAYLRWHSRRSRPAKP